MAFFSDIKAAYDKVQTIDVVVWVVLALLIALLQVFVDRPQGVHYVERFVNFLLLAFWMTLAINYFEVRKQNKSKESKFN